MKQSKTTCIIAVIILILVAVILGLYFSNFNDGLSTDSAQWANFGAYVGGVLGSSLSAASLFAVIFYSSEQINEAREINRKQIKQTRDSTDQELKTLKRENTIQHLKHSIEDCRKNFRHRDIPQYQLEIVCKMVSEHLDNKYVYIDKSRSFHVDKEWKFTFSDLTSLLDGLKLVLPEIRIKTIFKSRELGFLLSSRGALVTEIISYCSKLSELSSDRHLINATINEINHECICLYDYDILSTKHIELVKKLQSLPAPITFNIHPENEIINTLADILSEKFLCIADFQYKFNKEEINCYYLFTIQSPKHPSQEEHWEYNLQRWRKIEDYRQNSQVI